MLVSLMRLNLMIGLLILLDALIGLLIDCLIIPGHTDSGTNHCEIYGTSLKFELLWASLTTVCATRLPHLCGIHIFLNPGSIAVPEVGTEAPFKYLPKGYHGEKIVSIVVCPLYDDY